MRLFLPRLLLGLAIGLAAGLVYGWVIQPVEYVDTAPNTLDDNYRTDYVLMVAETYGAERDLGRAQLRLASLGPERPLAKVETAILYAVEHGLSRDDLSTLNQLAVDLRTLSPPTEAGSP
ncbi:MAG: hypothetical protein MUO23_05795 [Anaerolineales bacterium]|nr:hypothetical protein [Anaerolineales bacterium]